MPSVFLLVWIEICLLLRILKNKNKITDHFFLRIRDLRNIKNKKNKTDFKNEKNNSLGQFNIEQIISEFEKEPQTSTDLSCVRSR